MDGLTLNQIMMMKAEDAAEYVGMTLKKFYLWFKAKYGLGFREYKDRLAKDYIRKNYKEMEDHKLAANLGVCVSTVRQYRKDMKLDRRSRKKTKLLYVKSEEIKDILQDRKKPEYIRLKLLRKPHEIKPQKAKIIIEEKDSIFNFKIKCPRKLVAEGEYFREMPYNARKEILNCLKGIVENYT